MRADRFDEIQAAFQTYRFAGFPARLERRAAIAYYYTERRTPVARRRARPMSRWRRTNTPAPRLRPRDTTGPGWKSSLAAVRAFARTGKCRPLMASIIGGVLMIAFPLIIGLSMQPANIVTMVLLTLTISFAIFISIELMHPLHGPFSVAPDDFRAALDAFATPTSAGT
jgi:hypothetical protein